jgi:carboxyl-terminal processing protease
MKRMEESKGIYEEIMNVPFDYSIDESFNTDYDKAPYAKIQLNLLKDGESRLNCRLSSLTERLRVQEKKNKS